MQTLELFSTLDYLNKDFDGMIKNLIDLHQTGTITDKEFAQLLRVLGASFIEKEITEKLNRSVEKKILPRLLEGF